MRLIKSIVVRSMFVLFSAATLMAQTSTSEITGTVRDTTGAVVPGASVTATNEATGVVYKQSTTNAGLYAFSAVPADYARTGSHNPIYRALLPRPVHAERSVSSQGSTTAPPPRQATLQGPPARTPGGVLSSQATPGPEPPKPIAVSR